MNRFIFALLACTILQYSGLLLAAEVSHHLPSARVIQIPTGSADNSVGFRVTSQPFDRYPQVKGLLRKLGFPFFAPKITAGVNLTELSVSLIDGFINELGNFRKLSVDSDKKTLIFYTMNLGDKEVTRILIEAKRARLKKVHIIIDGQSGLKLRDDVHVQPKVTGAEHIEYLDNDAGHATRELIEEGFTVNDPDSAYNLSFQRVLRRPRERPLRHMKGVILLTDGPSNGPSLLSRLYPPNWWPMFTSLFSEADPSNSFEQQKDHDVRAAGYLLTDNATQREEINSVYNRMLEILERDLLLDQADHAERMGVAFAQKGQIKDVEAKPPQRLEYPDGSFVEQAFTDGKFNTNHYIVDLLNDANAGNITIEHAWLSEYSMAMDDFIEALREYMERNESMTIPLAVFDPSFVSGAGLAETFAGFANSSGKEFVRGFSPSACNRIVAYVRRQESANKVKTGKMTWHDKTSIFQVKEKDGKVWYYVLVGSANLTNHSEENAEISLFFKLPRNSELANWFITSITGHVIHKPELFAPIVRDSFRNAIGRLLGISPGSIDTNKIIDVERHLRANSYTEVTTDLKTIFTINDNGRVAAKEIDKRLELLTLFFKWYRRYIWPQKYYHGNPPVHIPLWTDSKNWLFDRILFGRTHLRIQQLGSIFKLIAERSEPGLELKQVKRLVNAMSPDSHFTDEQVEALARKMLKTLQVKGKLADLSAKDFEATLEHLRGPICAQALNPNSEELPERDLKAIAK